MISSQLLFCDSASLYCWISANLADTEGRDLQPENLDQIEKVRALINQHRDLGKKPACSLAAASQTITRFYKRPLPFTGGKGEFSARKSFAEKAGCFIRENIVLLSPGKDHFQKALEYWTEYCKKEIKGSFGEFMDYIDSAMILNPPCEYEIRDVIVSHEHIPFVLYSAKPAAGGITINYMSKLKGL